MRRILLALFDYGAATVIGCPPERPAINALTIKLENRLDAEGTSQSSCRLRTDLPECQAHSVALPSGTLSERIEAEHVHAGRHENPDPAPDLVNRLQVGQQVLERDRP